jgi:hypothetical protein
MSDLDPMAQADVEKEIRRLSDQLTLQTIGLGDAAMKAAQADVDYKRQMARAWIAHRGHKGTVPEKEAFIHGECEAEYEAMRLTEATHKVMQEKGRNLRAQLEALRSINANVRDHVMHGATGRGG